MRAILRAVVPDALLRRYRRWIARRRRAIDGRRPLAHVFRDIYARGLWSDGTTTAPDSGAGSTPAQAAAYAAFVRDFVVRLRVKTVVDLGCGDYRVGRLLRVPGVRYVGVDVVPAVVERNRALASADPGTEFVCRDFLTDDLPPGDLCLVRQVLQHLSNAEIAVALRRIRRYRYALVTEHHPAAGRMRERNVDKPHGPDTRLLDGSGVFLEAPPFSCAARLVLEAPVERPMIARGEMLRTYLVEGAAIAVRPEGEPSADARGAPGA